MLPALMWGTWISDSFINNLAWVEGVSVEMQRGAIYPRWLSTGYEGFGSPSFYFYPPLPFLLTGATAAVLHPWLSYNAIIQLFALLALVASGGAMFTWLRHYAPARHALLGSVLYMLMPYHLTDHYTRGALGEFTSYVLIPLLLVFIESMAGSSRKAIGYFALTYCALVLTHLPTAVLTTLLLIPAFALWVSLKSAKPLKTLIKIGVAGILGTTLSAGYLLPALTLQENISSQRLWEPRFQPDFWFLSNLSNIDDFKIVVTYIIYFALILTLLLFWAKVRKHFRSETRDASFFFLVALVLLALIFGLVPWLWDIPVLAKVQFPWRALVLVDILVVATFTICLPYFRGANSMARLASLGLVFILGSLANSVFINRDMSIGELRYAQNQIVVREPFEYRAPNCALLPSNNRFEARLIPAQAGEVKLHREGRMLVVDARTTMAARVILPQHNFPSWAVFSSDGTPLQVISAEESCLISFDIPPGEARYEAKLQALPVEKVGWLTTLVTLFLIAAIIASDILSKRVRHRT